MGFILWVCDLESVVQNWNLFAGSPSWIYADRLLRNPFMHTDAHRFIKQVQCNACWSHKKLGSDGNLHTVDQVHTLSPLLLTVSGSLHLLRRLNSRTSSPFQHKNEILMHPTNPFPPRPTLHFVNPLHKNEKNIQLGMTKSCLVVGNGYQLLATPYPPSV